MPSLDLPQLAHLHLLLNHWPIMGTIMGFGLLVVAALWKSDDVKRAALVVFSVVGLLTLPTYLSGNAAALRIADRPGLSVALIETHQGAAFIALIFMVILGTVAWYGLWLYRRESRLSNGNLKLVWILAILTIGFMTVAGNTGGDITHGEIRAAGAGGPAPSAIGSLGAKIIAINSGFILSKGTHWGISETTHFLGMALLWGVVIIVDLRMLGLMKGIPFQSMHRLLPYGVFGYALMVATGFWFYISSPQQYAENWGFQYKMLFLVIVGFNFLYFTMFDEPWELKAGDDASTLTKLIAVSAIGLMLGVMVFGRLLPWLGSE